MDNITPPEPRYPAIENLAYPNKFEAQENDLKSNLINMIESVKEVMNKSPQETQENTINQDKEYKQICLRPEKGNRSSKTNINQGKPGDGLPRRKNRQC